MRPMILEFYTIYYVKSIIRARFPLSLILSCVDLLQSCHNCPSLPTIYSFSLKFCSMTQARISLYIFHESFQKKHFFPGQFSVCAMSTKLLDFHVEDIHMVYVPSFIPRTVSTVGFAVLFKGFQFSPSGMYV